MTTKPPPIEAFEDLVRAFEDLGRAVGEGLARISFALQATADDFELSGPAEDEPPSSARG